MSKLNSSVEAHIKSTNNLLSAAEMFVSGAEDAKALKASAERFISTAESHIASAEMVVSSSEKHLSSLQKIASTAEKSVTSVTNFLGAEDKVSKGSKPR